jgi:hypothetical protein
MDIVDQIPRVLLIIGGIFVATFLCSIYLFEHGSDRAGLLQVTQSYKMRIVELEANNDQQRSLLAAAEINKKQVIEVYKFVERRDSLQEEVNKLKDEKNVVLEDFYNSVLVVREAAKNIAVTQLELKNKKKLYDVRVSKVDATGIGLIHNDGITRVPFSEMPESMLTRFRPDIEEAMTQLKESKVVRASSDVAATVMSTVTEAPNQNSDKVVSAEPDLEVLKLQSQLSLIEFQINRLESERQRYLDKADSYRSNKPAESKIHSNPAVASAAERAAKELDPKITALRVSQAQLQLKLRTISY